MPYALRILKLINPCALTYFALLHILMASIYTGAEYKNCGSIAPLYIGFIASCLSIQLILADINKALTT